MALCLALAAAPASAQSAEPSSAACGDAHSQAVLSDSGELAGRDAAGEIAIVQGMARQVAGKSFPQLARVDWRVRKFGSDYDYLRTRFSLWRFFLPLRMRYYVEINPALFQRHAPAEGVCAILAHELTHVRDLSHGMRIRRLGLVRLVSRKYTVKFERRTDLEAIHRGYASGLAQYRIWIYANIPPEKLALKKRVYFTPEEIQVIDQRLNEHPELYADWRKHVPLDVKEAKETVHRP